MSVRSTVRLACGACALLLLATPASAEIVYLTSGRTLSVKDHREDGDSIVLSLRGGGEVTFSRSLVAKIVPDEVPHPEPEEQAATPADAQSVLKSTPYGDIIATVSEAQGVNPLLVRAVIQVESNYQPRARSRKGAMGLMQLMPATARAYQVRKPFDPKANIEAGVRHLKTLIDRWGVELALAAYNAGEGAVEHFQGIPPYRETRSYVSRILSLAGLR
ncbi:MAG TPA: lytic transglycosylase domain-containing protein [Vicinamibacterales bacterium]|nr:lytic transglycosylase domain-containing protein [Vicinamibacterales bacterium]